MRGLNNCFSYDLVPSLEVVEAALRASRRCNDYAMAVRVRGQALLNSDPCAVGACTDGASSD